MRIRNVFFLFLSFCLFFFTLVYNHCNMASTFILYLYYLYSLSINQQIFSSFMHFHKENSVNRVMFIIMDSDSERVKKDTWQNLALSFQEKPNVHWVFQRLFFPVETWSYFRLCPRSVSGTGTGTDTPLQTGNCR